MVNLLDSQVAMIKNKNWGQSSSTAKQMNSAKIMAPDQKNWEAIPARSINSKSMIGERNFSKVSEIYIA